MSKEAMKLALEALEDYVEEYGPHEKDSGAAYAITAIREALTEQPRLLSAAPCDQCGYNGPGYYQPDTHQCAAKHHKALAEQPAQVAEPRKQQEPVAIADGTFNHNCPIGTPLYTSPQPAQQRLPVGDSKFESWFSEYNPAGKGTKQQMRDAYAAGMGDPLEQPAQQQEPYSTLNLKATPISGWGQQPIGMNINAKAADWDGGEEKSLTPPLDQQQPTRQQKPVAYASDVEFDDETEIIPAEQKGKLGTAGLRIPLYIDPPASKPWVGLTEEEVSKLVSCTRWRSDESMHTYAVRACHAIEAKLREKNA